MRSPLRIRAGRRSDVPTIVALIRGLAEYERLAHEMQATVAQIRAHGFGRRRYFETLLCFDGRRPIGFALYFFTYSAFYERLGARLRKDWILTRLTGPALRRLGRARRAMPAV